jgi:hypothetical protein
MSVYIKVNTLCNNNTFKDLVIPSCLFINPIITNKQLSKLNLDNDFLISDKIYNIFIDNNSNLNKKKYTKSNKNNSKKSKTFTKKNRHYN